MLLFENACGRINVDRIFGDFVPGQTDQPIQVISQNRVFGHRWGDLLKMLQFLESDLLHFFGQAVFVDLLFQRVGFVCSGIGFAQFALNSADLFAQEIIALALGHRAGDFVLNL